MEITISLWWHWALVFMAFSFMALFGLIVTALLSSGCRSDLECEIIRLQLLSETKHKVIMHIIGLNKNLDKSNNDLAALAKKLKITKCPADGSTESNNIVELIKEAENDIPEFGEGGVSMAGYGA